MTPSRRNLLKIGAAAGVAAAATTSRAATFGNPDEPPQGAINTNGNPSSLTIPGPQNPLLSSQFPNSISPPATDAGSMPQFWATFNNSQRRIQDGRWARARSRRRTLLSPRHSQA